MESVRVVILLSSIHSQWESCTDYKSKAGSEPSQLGAAQDNLIRTRLSQNLSPLPLSSLVPSPYPCPFSAPYPPPSLYNYTYSSSCSSYPYLFLNRRRFPRLRLCLLFPGNADGSCYVRGAGCGLVLGWGRARGGAQEGGRE